MNKQTLDKCRLYGGSMRVEQIGADVVNLVINIDTGLGTIATMRFPFSLGGTWAQHLRDISAFFERAANKVDE